MRKQTTVRSLTIVLAIGFCTSGVAVAQETVGRAAIVRWHKEMQSGGATTQEARKKLVKHSAEAAPYLIEQLKQDRDNRSNLVYLMGFLTDACVPFLCAEAANEQSPIRADVFEVLTRFTPASGDPIPELADVAMAGVASEDPEVLRWVFNLLSGMRSFTELHLEDASPIGARCAVALAGYPQAVMAVVAATDDANAFVRSRAVEQLALLPGRSVLSALTNLVSDQDEVHL